MTNEMKQFLTELSELLKKHNAHIESEEFNVLLYMPLLTRFSYKLIITRQKCQVDFEKSSVDADDIQKLLNERA